MHRAFHLITLYDQMVTINDGRLGRMPFAILTGNFKVADGLLVVGGQAAGAVLLKMDCQAVLPFSMINL